MTPNDVRRDELFRILALRTDFISGEALNAALQAQQADATRSLGELLVEQGTLTEARRALLEELVEEHIRGHNGDLEGSVAALGPSTAGEVETENLFHSLPNPLQPTETLVPRDPWSTAGAGGVPPQVPTLRAEPSGPTPEVSAVPGSALRYRLLRGLARGGLGEVFVAHDEDLKREVALKQIREKHAHDPRSRSRFLAEAEITGHLEHPGIVPIYGLGFHGDGRPYYAMRLIRGVTLGKAIQTFHEAAHAPRRDPAADALELRRLLRRFVDVCNAISYAHSRGVLHRDLKPDNIMLGKYGETLVVDWGLAKMMDAPVVSDSGAETAIRLSAGSGSHVTQEGSAMGTPAYMSPEQASGALARLGPRSDVYSLGATLYCILVGKAPFDRGDDKDSDGETLRGRVRRGEFPHPRAVNPGIARPLEAICLKAMATNPEARYPTPRALADDLERWLAGAPVSAWPEPLSVRAGRWLARHRSLMTVVAASTVIALIGAASVGLVQARANRTLKESNQRLEVAYLLALDAIQGYYTGASEDVLLKQPQFEALRGRLLRAPLEFYKRLIVILEEKGGGDRRERENLGMACVRVAQINAEIGSKEDARAAYHQAIPVYERITRDHPVHVNSWISLASCHDGLAAVEQAMGRAKEASLSRQRALQIWETLEREHPDNVRIKAFKADCLRGIGQLQSEAGAHADALRSFAQARAILEALVTHDGVAPEIESNFAECLIGLGIAQQAAGKKVEALSTYRTARLRIREMAARHDDAADLRRQEARCLLSIAQYQTRDGSSEDALSTYHEAQRILERLIDSHPVITRYQRDLAACRMGMMWLFRNVGRMDEAKRSFEEALKIVKGLVKLNPEVIEFQGTLAWCYGEYGLFLKDAKQWNEALEMMAEARAIIEKVAEANPGLIEYKIYRVHGMNNAADILLLAGRFEQAATMFEKALQSLIPLLDQQSDNPDLRHLMGEIHDRLGSSFYDMKKFEPARREFETAIEHERLALQAEPESEIFRRNLYEQYGHLINVYRRLNRPAKLASAAVERQAISTGNSDRLFAAALDLASCLEMVGTGAERETYADQAMTALRAAVDAGFRDVKRLREHPALAPLRSRADFESLVQEVSNRASSSDPVPK